MEEKDKIALAQDWVCKLANGINPNSIPFIKI